MRSGRIRSVATLAAAVALGTAARAASAYDAIVAPIFRARCAECHGAETQKAKLALHTWEAAAKGSDAGPIWVAGKPAESTLLERMRLPLEDEEHMPPKDRPQPGPEELALLARWVERGASPSAPLADLQLPPELAKAAAELPRRLAELPPPRSPAAVAELDPEAVKQARAPLAAKVAELQERFPGALSYESRSSARLHFTAAGLGRSFGDNELAALAPLADALVELDLSATAITDTSAPVLAGFRNLRVLRAGFTAVGDATAAAIAGLEKLESLSLHGSGVTAGGVTALTRLAGLRRLHLAGTAAAPAAREAKLPVVETAGF